MPHRILRRDYLVMEGTGKTGALSFATFLRLVPGVRSRDLRSKAAGWPNKCASAYRGI